MRSNMRRTPAAGSLPVSTLTSVSPPLDQLDVEAELVEGATDDEVDKVMDGLSAVVEARREEEHRCARLLNGEHVAEMDERQGRLARHQHELPFLLQRHRDRAVDEVRHRAGSNRPERAHRARADHVRIDLRVFLGITGASGAPYA